MYKLCKMKVALLAALCVAAIVITTSFSVNAASPPRAMAACDPQNDVTTTTPRLFEYPYPPESITDFEERVNYIVSHFWESVDLSKPIRDTVAFEAALRDYVDFFRYAHREVVFSSIKDFMYKAQSNTSNTVLIMEMAERALFGLNMVYWSDEVYLEFCRMFIDSKKVKQEQKIRYIDQVKRIENTLQDCVPVDFTAITPDKHKLKLSSISGWVLIYFNEPDCFDCTITRLRLNTNQVISDYVEYGQLTVLAVYPGEWSQQWVEDANSMPKEWTYGCCESIDELYDIRFIPSFYLLNREHKLVGKNLTLEDVQQLLAGGQ